MANIIYPLSTGATANLSSYVSKTEATASLARLGAVNSFTANQNITGSLTVTNNFGDDTAIFLETDSFSFGNLNEVYANRSFLHGTQNKSYGIGAHAEGFLTKASGTHSHVEGLSTITSGSFSHAEGESTKTIGDSSHAEGYGTIAYQAYQHAEGKWNKNSTALLIVGNGVDDTLRSNILEVHTSSVNILGKSVFSGSQIVNTNIKISNYTASAEADYYLSFSGSNLTATLPQASTSRGSVFILKNKHTSPLFINTLGGLIDGQSSATITTRYYSYTLISDGIDWNII